MKIAALWSNRPAANRMARAFDARSIEIASYPDPASLFDAWPHDGHDAVLVHDERPWLRPWLAALRAHPASLQPIIVIGPGDAQAIAQALMWGADDYASEAEGPSGWVQRVLGRIRARATTVAPGVPTLGPYALDFGRGVVAASGRSVKLTSRESLIARVLLEGHGRLHATDMLAASVFGGTGPAQRRSIEQHIYKLRKKFELVSSGQPQSLWIESVYGSGYRAKLAAAEVK